MCLFVMTLCFRLQTQMNLQLCFINNSESEEEEEKDGDVTKKESSSSWVSKTSETSSL